MKKLSFFLMAMLFSVMSFAETYSLTPNKDQTGLTNTSYITTLTEFEYNGVSWKMNQWNPSSLQVKTNQSSAASEWRFYNTSAFPGKITKVVIKFSALTLSNTTTTGFKFVGGSAAVTATSGGTDGVWNATAKTLTWTPKTDDNFTYFALYQNGKVATGTNKLATSDAIVVTYENAGGSAETIVKTLKSIAVEGMTTTYEQGDVFRFDGTCTATYNVTKNDEPQADETKTVTPIVSAPDMNKLGTQVVTVSYTDDKETVSTTYNINIIENTVTPGTYTGNLNNTFFGCSAGNNGTELSGKFDDILVVSGCKVDAQNKTYYDATHVRFYTDTYLKISVPEGYAITSIKLIEATDNFKWDGQISVNKGTYTEDTKSWSGYEQEVQFSFAKQNRIASISVTYELLDVKHIAAPIISGNVEFVESTEVTISAEDGLKVYYTLDGTDPTNASTEYTAPFELTATTTVKAVAYDGENASDIISKTFKQLQVLTCEEAAELCAATESADKYVIRGYVTNIAYAYDAGFNNTSFWMADTKNGGKVFEAYRAQPVAAADKAVKVGDYVEVIGKIVLYGTTPETSAGGTYTIIPAPVVNHTITVSANPAEAGTVTGGGEFEETDEITVKAVANEGYEFVNWTEGETVVSTEANYSFAVLADRNLVANFKKSVVTHDFYAEGVTVSEGGWSIDLSGSWNEQAFVLKLWQDNTQGFGTYAANAETGYSAVLGVKELTPTAEGYYMEDPMNANAFIFQGTMTDGTDIYEVYLKGALASTGTGEMEAKDDVTFSCDADGAWTIEAYADDVTWGLSLNVAQDPETMEWIAEGYYITNLEAGTMEEAEGTGLLYFDDFSGRQVFKGTLTTTSGEIYPTLYASSLDLMTNELMTGPSWVGEFAGVDYYEVLLTAADYSWELDLHAANCTGANGTYTIDVVDEEEGAYSTFMGSTIVTGELTIEDGMYEAYVTTVDSEGNPAMSISVLAWAAAAEEYDIVINNATVTDNTSGYNIDLTGEWEEHTIKVEVCDELTAETILANFFIDGGIANGGDQAEGKVEATVSEGVVTITGTFECLGSGNVYNVTISGTLPGGTTTSLDKVEVSASAVKVIENGQLIVIKNGVKYNVLGAKL